MIWLVGAGIMAKEYVRVLKGCSAEFLVVGRGEPNAAAMEKEFGITVLRGGLENALNQHAHPEHIILATPVELLGEGLKTAISAGIKNILIEKPGFLHRSQGEELLREAKARGLHVHIAYNRRFFSSVFEMERLIKQDGGLRSFQFEFTEWADDIASLGKDPRTLDRWVLSNSSHVIDLAFHVGSVPQTINCVHTGHLAWHPAAAYFTGAGQTKSGALFSYSASWDSPGRWGVEMMTKNLRFILRPMEKLVIQRRNSLKIEEVPLEDEWDRSYKPGLYWLVEAFLDPRSSRRSKLCTLEEQVNMFPIYEKMANYH